MQQQDFPTFSSRLVFILLTAGAAVGLGNVWGFTYVAGQNGGGGFVLIYILALLLAATPVFMAELLLGRMGRASPPTALKKLQKQEGHKIPWAPIAWVGLVSTILILSFYAVVAGQAVYYGFVALTGGFAGWSEDQIIALDAGFKSAPLLPALWAAVFMAATVFVVSFDIRSGLERTGKYLMPALFVMLVMMAVYAGIVGDFAAAADFLFGFHKMDLSPRIVMEAVGQAFFSVSVGVGGIMMYGAYMGRDVILPRATLWIVGMDLGVALLAGLAIFPLVFAAENVTASAGPGLVFLTLPMIFTDLAGGAFVAFVFFLLLFFAALTSAISLLAPSVARLEEAGWSRPKAAISMGFATLVLSSLTILSFSRWSDFYPLVFMGLDGMTPFDLIREGVNNIVLPFAGLIFALMVGWGLSKEKVREALPVARGRLYDVWHLWMRFFVPMIIFVLFVTVGFGH